jgi:hypothetical protein
MNKRFLLILSTTLISLLTLCVISTSSNAIDATSARAEERSPKTNGELSLRILFQGGNVSDNAVKVLMALHRIEPLPLKSHTVKAGETLLSICADRLDLPMPTPKCVDLATEINKKDYRNVSLVVGEDVVYPDVDLDEKEATSSFNLSVESDRAEMETVKQTWAGYIKKEETDKGKVNLELQSFALEIPRGTPEKLNESIDRVNLFTDRSIRVETTKLNVETPNFTFGVRLQGVNVIADAEQLLESLLSLGVVRLAKHTVRAGDTLDSIYADRLGISGSFARFADNINKQARPTFDPNKLVVGEEVLVPDVQFQTFKWTKRISLNSPEGQRELSNFKSQLWKHLLLDVIQKSPDTSFAILRGYQLTIDVGSRDKLEAVHNKLAQNSSKDIRLSFPSLESGIKALHSAEDPRDGNSFWNECCSNMRRGVQGFIGSYLNMQITDSVKAASRCTGNDCPQIVLIDRNIKPHPDIAAALIDDKGSPIRTVDRLVDEGTNTQTISKGEYTKNEDHGTHMAGIIASRDNEFGLVGINPYAKIFPVDSDIVLDNDPFAFDDLIYNRITIGPLQIFVFASEWSIDTETGKSRSATIKTARPLFIASAGQNEQVQGAGMAIVRGSTMAPMNLGTEPNVIIVTGCVSCYGQNGQPRQLDTRANYSGETDKFVHIAAPMQPVPSTLSGGGYGVTGGTSQAAAMVGGIASLMSSSFSTYYSGNPWRMKLRLIITSLPELSPTDSNRIAGGIVDPSRALLDPHLYYFVGTTRDAPPSEVKPVNWCAPTIELRSPGSVSPDLIKVDLIHRIYKTERGNWVIYYTDNPQSAVVRKAGPGVIRGQDDFSLFARDDGKVIKLDGITDFILPAHGLKKVRACAQ